MDRGRLPSDAEWRRLAGVFGRFFALTVTVAVVFAVLSPLPPLVEVILAGPPVLVTGWIWIFVVLRRDADRLRRLTTLAARRRGRRR